MSKQDLDYKTVAKAADTIKKRGIEPSLTDVRNELGMQRVSLKLTELLEKWYHNQPDFKRKINAPLIDNINLKTSKIVEKNIEMQKSLAILRATLESTADGIMMVNGKGKIVDWNQKFVDMWRIPPHMMEDGRENISFDYILDQLTDPNSLISDVQYLYQNPDWQGELPALQFKDGRIFERYTQPLLVDKEIGGRVFSFRDVTEKKIAEEELRIRDRAVQASAHGVIIIDVLKPDHPIMYVNDSFTKITGYNEKMALGENIITLQGREGDELNNKRVALAIKELREEMIEVECIRKNGELYWCELSFAPVNDASGQVHHYVCLLNDITERRELQDQLLKQATHDSLTELPNRVLLIDRVEQAILQANKNKTMIAFIFLDLDRFKMTNDSLGHGMGDKLLQVISNRLLISTDNFDTVARLGGDEFAILLPNLTDKKKAEDFAKGLLNTIEKTVKINQHEMKVTASIGISYYPEDGKNYESLMKNADLSMYHAKDAGRNTFRLYDPEMKRQVINTMQMDTALRHALETKELYPVYQPIIDLKENKIYGLETLLRWKNKEMGHIAPLDFIPVAEENGQIVEISAWLMIESCKQAVRWHEMGLKDLRVAINVSSRQFREERGLIEAVKMALKRSHLPPSCLELELTETLLIENIEQIVATMKELKELGVKLVVDDFGTGYSSLSYLKQFPVDTVKIDRYFVNEMVSSKNDAAITKTIINLGHSLNLKVVAEGVENEFQKNFLLANGCDFAQGYYYVAPQKPADLKEYLLNYPNLLE